MVIGEVYQGTSFTCDCVRFSRSNRARDDDDCD